MNVMNDQHDPRAADRAVEAPNWHARDVDAVFARLKTSATGLSPGEADARLSQYGPNRLPEPPRRSALARFLSQFNSVLIYVLLAAAVVTMLLGHWLDSAVILAVVIGNAAIGFIQEGKAEQALDAIREMLSPSSIVVRDGHRKTIPAEELAPGDVVHLEAGDRVPADLRLFQVRGAAAEEAILTGESVASDKATEPVAPDAPLGDRTCMAYSGTFVTKGVAQGVVVATGAGTEIGRISSMMSEIERLTSPLLRSINHFSKVLTAAILALSLAMFLFGWLVQDYGFSELFMAVVGIAVAAIPEGLPAVLAVTLALGAQAMAGRHAIARKLPAIETLGSVNVICTDKTGTLTRNEMHVAALCVDGDDLELTELANKAGQHGVNQGVHDLLRAGVLASDAELDAGKVAGDPMEGALLFAADAFSLDVPAERSHAPRLDTIPFDSRHRFMASLHAERDGTRAVYVKGAPERVLEMCATVRTPTGDAPIDVAQWTGRIDRLTADGRRVLAVCTKTMGTDKLDIDSFPEDLTLLGLIGLEDPPREEAKTAVAETQAAGIRVKMITGDHPATAQAIASRLGLGRADNVLTGAELDAMDAASFDTAVAETDIFARTSPENKLRLVEALQARGAVVAMTGDGVNDAPALKRADIGVAMGRKGSEAAKEASDLVLADDNFATIAAAVREGRRVYANIVKTIEFMLPTNGGESLVLVIALLLGITMPITPVQILWVNLVTAVTLALVFAFEPAAPDVMARPPRDPDEPILSLRLVWRIVFASVLFLLGVLGMFYLARANGAGLAEARTVAVNTLVVFEIVYLFSVRGFTALVRSGRYRDLFPKPVVIAVLAVIGAQLLFTYTPVFQTLFGTAPLDGMTWAAIGLAGVAVFLAVEAERALEPLFERNTPTATSSGP